MFDSPYYYITVFLWSDATVTIYFTTRFVQLLFEGGYYSRVTFYFFAKPGDIKDSWIRYIRVGRWRLLDTVSSTRSLSVLLSAMGTTRTTQTILALAWWPLLEIIPTRVHMPRLLAAVTIWGQCLFRSRASDCAATIWGRHLFEELRYAQHGGLCP